MPEREGWFSVGTDSPVGVKLMMEPARLVPRRAVEKLGVVTNTVCCLTWRPQDTAAGKMHSSSDCFLVKCYDAGSSVKLF